MGKSDPKNKSRKVLFLNKTSCLDLAFLSLFMALYGIALHSSITNKAAGLVVYWPGKKCWL